MSQNKYFNRWYLGYGVSQSFEIWNLSYVEIRRSITRLWLKRTGSTRLLKDFWEFLQFRLFPGYLKTASGKPKLKLFEWRKLVWYWRRQSKSVSSTGIINFIFNETIVLKSLPSLLVDYNWFTGIKRAKPSKL